MRDSDNLALGRFPRAFLNACRRYFRIEVEGIENVPRRGRAILAPNHSGCTGFDGAILSCLVRESTRRIPRILAFWPIFERLTFLATAAQRLGLKEATASAGIRLLRKNNLIVVFPEGEAGSFKPSALRYRLQPFRTGFVRLALLTGAPVVPCLVIGAEESNINLGAIRLRRLAPGMILPIPLNLIPLPAKWRVIFFPPLDLSGYKPEDANDKAKMTALAQRVQRMMQHNLDAALQRRDYVYFEAA